MSEHDYVLANAAGATFRADLNLALLAIVSNNSKATEPTATYAYMWWYDTANNLFKMRNADDDAWITVGTFDQTNDLFTPFISDPKVGYRSEFIFKDIDEIYLNGGVYRHAGTKTQMLEWNSQLTYQFQNLAVSDWSYLYFDDSAIVTAGTHVITATELTDNVTEPVWNDTKKGWYHPTNTNDLCIFAVWTNGSSEILYFTHADNEVEFVDEITVETDLNIGTGFGDASPFTMPVFSRKCGIYMRTDYVDDNNVIFYIPNGSPATVGHRILPVTSALTRSIASLTVLTGPDHKIELRESVGSTNLTDIRQKSYFIPAEV